MTTKSILLIEHEANIREILHTCLIEFGGWRVTLSSSVQEGVDLCVTACPDVILLDASTPETDALIFLEQSAVFVSLPTSSKHSLHHQHY